MLERGVTQIIDEALANIEEGWEEVTEDVVRDAQVASQALALGL